MKRSRAIEIAYNSAMEAKRKIFQAQDAAAHIEGELGQDVSRNLGRVRSMLEQLDNRMLPHTWLREEE